MILIPEAVYAELTRFKVPGCVEAQTLDWIQTVAVQNVALVQQLEAELDAGEAAAIALAIERQATLLLMDERRGVEVATRYDLNVQGVLGALVLAKSRGLIPAVQPFLDQLIQDAGFWMARDLYRRVLLMVNEQ